MSIIAKAPHLDRVATSRRGRTTTDLAILFHIEVGGPWRDSYGQVEYWTIGDAGAVGLGGSGMLDGVAEWRWVDVVGISGALKWNRRLRVQDAEILGYPRIAGQVPGGGAVRVS